MKRNRMHMAVSLTVAAASCGLLGCAAELNDSPDTSEGEQIGVNQQAGGFYDSCAEIHVAENHLVGQCRDVRGDYYWSWLSLDLGIANNNGDLTWQPHGGYSSSCDCIFTDLTYLNCACRRVDGSWKHATIDLNQMISNQNGVLAFDFPL